MRTDSGTGIKKIGMVSSKKTITTAVVVFLAFLLLFYFVIPVLAGSIKLLVVLSGSMTPFMQVGDIIVVDSTAPEDLKVGDVLAMYMPDKNDTVLTHRIMAIDENLNYITKGDNNEDIDTFIANSTHVIGKTVFILPLLGYFSRGDKKGILFVLFIALPSALILLDEAKNVLILSERTSRKKYEQMQKKQDRLRRHVRVRYEKLTVVAVIAILLSSSVLMLPLEKTEHNEIVYSAQEYAPEHIIKTNGEIIDVGAIAIGVGNSRTITKTFYNDLQFPLQSLFNISLPVLFVANVKDDKYGEISNIPGYVLMQPNNTQTAELVNMVDCPVGVECGTKFDNGSTSTMEFTIAAKGPHIRTKAKLDVTCSYYILPVMWIILMSQIHPVLPNIVEIFIVSLLIVSFTSPLWIERRKTKTRHMRKIMVRMIIRNLKK